MLEPLYNKFYKDWLSTEKSGTTYDEILKDELEAEYGDDFNINTLTDMLLHKYRYHEICSEDDNVFFDLIFDKICSYAQYYIEMLIAYNTQINFLDGKKTVVTREDESNGSGSSSGSNSSIGKGYELPNKTINEGLGNLSNASTSTGENENESSYEDHSEGTLTTIGDVDVVDAKRRYLNLIRNLYSEWADKVYDCFIGLYN